VWVTERWTPNGMISDLSLSRLLGLFQQLSVSLLLVLNLTCSQSGRDRDIRRFTRRPNHEAASRIHEGNGMPSDVGCVLVGSVLTHNPCKPGILFCSPTVGLHGQSTRPTSTNAVRSQWSPSVVRLQRSNVACARRPTRTLSRPSSLGMYASMYVLYLGNLSGLPCT
jgi:hypothetical protein